MSLAKCSFLNSQGAPKRESQETILEKKIDLNGHQKYISNAIAFARGLARFDEQEFGGSEAPQEDLKILQNRRSEIEDRST